MAIYATASALLDAVRVETDWNGASDTLALQLLNRAFLRIQREYTFWWQEYQSSALVLAPAASGAYCTFAEPTDCKEILQIYHLKSSGDYLPLEHIRDFPAALELYPNPDQTSLGDADHNRSPFSWSRYAGQYWIFPKWTSTGETIKLFYRRFLGDFTATASNNFLVSAPDALLHATKAEYYEVTGENSKAQYERQLTADAVSSVLVQHVAAEQEPGRALYMRPVGTITRRARGPWGRRG